MADRHKTVTVLEESFSIFTVVHPIYILGYFRASPTKSPACIQFGRNTRGFPIPFFFSFSDDKLDLVCSHCVDYFGTSGY